MSSAYVFVFVVSQISCLSGTFLAQRELAHYQNGRTTNYLLHVELAEVKVGNMQMIQLGGN